MEISSNNEIIKETPIKQLEKGGTINKDTLIVTPQRLIIPPAGFQQVRVIWTGDRNVERYYRIRFSPVLPKMDDGFGLDKDKLDKYKKENEVKAGVNILTGYGSVLFVSPKNPHYNTVISKNEKEITFKNSGDSTIALEKVKSCVAKNNECESLGETFILPGRDKSLERKSADAKIEYTLVEGNKNSQGKF